MLEVAPDPIYRGFGPTLLAEHLDRDHGVRLSAKTVRCWMRDAELWELAAEAGEAPEPAATAGGGGGAVPVGQFGASLAGGPGRGRLGADRDARLRLVPPPEVPELARRHVDPLRSGRRRQHAVAYLPEHRDAIPVPNMVRKRTFLLRLKGRISTAI